MRKLLVVGLGLVFALWIAGLVTAFGSAYLPGLKPWTVALYAIPAAFGGLHAGRALIGLYRERRFYRLHPRLPLQLSLDPESRYAMVTLADGELVSLEVPAEVIAAGGEEIVEFVMRELEP